MADPRKFWQMSMRSARDPACSRDRERKEDRDMPPERSDIDTLASFARPADASAAHDDACALAALATNGDPALEAAFWRARAEALATGLARLEDRVRALGARLPSRWAQLLVSDLEDLPELAHWPDPLASWRESTELEPARVASALPRLWDRLDRDASR